LSFADVVGRGVLKLALEREQSTRALEIQKRGGLKLPRVALADGLARQERLEVEFGAQRLQKFFRAFLAAVKKVTDQGLKPGNVVARRLV
jgi:hypothetical protein